MSKWTRLNQQLSDRQSWYFTLEGPAKTNGRYLDVRLMIHMPWAATKQYEYSKLYYRLSPDSEFTESQVICFRLRQQGRIETFRIALPEVVRQASWAEFRIDLFPYCSGGVGFVDHIEIVDADDEVSRRADLMAHKQWVREQVVACEQRGKREVEHFPESLCMEVTPRCNLTCSHCATHGTPEAHSAHNKMSEIPKAFLEQLSANVFPSLTSVTAIGRGEPLYLTDETWNDLIEHLRRNHVLLSVVTNGLLIKKRLTPEIISMIDTLTVSIDGLSQDVFGENRGEASFEKILNNIRYYHETRKSLSLPRRPRLCISWTMKRNNIGELLEFLEVAKEFEPDIMFTRHLMIFHERDVGQSLINSPEICNPILEQVYARMKELGIKTECPPLSENQLIASDSPPDVPVGRGLVRTAGDEPRPAAVADPCMFVYRTANIHTDGRIHVCPRPNAPYVGSMHDESFMDIWHGKKYGAVRSSLDSDNELIECRDCWYRESKYHPQRFQRNRRNEQNFSVLEPVSFTERAWDFRERYVNIVELDNKSLTKKIPHR